MRDLMETLTCDCGNIIEVLFVKDMGMAQPYDDNDLICDQCGEELEW